MSAATEYKTKLSISYREATVLDASRREVSVDKMAEVFGVSKTRIRQNIASALYKEAHNALYEKYWFENFGGEK